MPPPAGLALWRDLRWPSAEAHSGSRRMAKQQCVGSAGGLMAGPAGPPPQGSTGAPQRSPPC
eukprot:6196251-Pleurochrysis_carterae.AAC.5